MAPAGGEYGTALHAASHQGHLKIVKLLLEKGVGPNVQGAIFAILRSVGDMFPAGDKYGTALQAAAASSSGNLNVVRLLFEKGADLNAHGGSFVIPKVYNSHYTCRRQVRDGTPSSVTPGKSGNCDTPSREGSEPECPRYDFCDLEDVAVRWYLQAASMGQHSKQQRLHTAKS
jgi:ankyrin repeat protein